MKTKKSKKADLEKKRPLFFTIALLISLSVVLLAFTRKTPATKTQEFDKLIIEAPVEELTQIIREEKKEVFIPKKEIVDFKLVTDETEIKEDFTLFESEIGKDDPVDVQVFITKQAPEKEDDVPVWIADEMPEFPGGMGSLLKYINSSIRYPAVAQENGIYGRVIVTFVINKMGDVTDVRIFRGVDSSLDSEALRVVKSLPRWLPGKQNGRAVNVNYNVPINFVLQ